MANPNMGQCSKCGEPAKSLGMCRKHYRSAWGKLNPDTRKRDRKSRNVIQQRYYAKNRTRILDKQAKFYIDNRDRLLGRCESWRKENPEAARRQSSKRRALIRNVEGSHTLDEIRVLYDLQNHRCAVCGKDMPDKKYTVDHIEPLSRGGSNYIANIQLLCAYCNKHKGAKDPITFMQSKGFLL